MLAIDLYKRALLSLLPSDSDSAPPSGMSLPLVTATLCAAAAAAARRSPASSSWGRVAALAAASSTPTTLAYLQSNDRLHRHTNHFGNRRCFAHDREPPLRRTATNDIVGGRSTIGVFTPITASLWIERLQREEGATLPPKPAEGPLPPSASAVAVKYNFTTDAQLRELYRNPWNGVRIGRILEDLDSLAGSIALNHFDGSSCRSCGGRSGGEEEGDRKDEGEEERRRPPVLVTASVDAIELLSPLSVDEDVEARGQVVYTGKTSMDIRLELHPAASSKSQGEGEEEEERGREPSPALVAHFTFACRDESNRPLAVPQLAPETELERERFAERAAQAEERRLRRRAKAASAVAEASSALSNSRALSSSISKSFLSSLSTPMPAPAASIPEGEEAGGDLEARIEAVADQLIREAAAAADMPALASGDAIFSKLTATGNTFLCQPQQRNITGRIFGGFLMRRAFELAFASCYVHCGFKPRFAALERVEFMAPVAVGDLLRLRGKVLHVSSPSFSSVAEGGASRATVRIRVRADVVKPEQAASEISNTFVFAFEVPLRGSGGNEEGTLSVKRVLPETREEALAAATYEVVSAGEKRG